MHSHIKAVYSGFFRCLIQNNFPETPSQDPKWMTRGPQEADVHESKIEALDGVLFF